MNIIVLAAILRYNPLTPELQCDTYKTKLQLKSASLHTYDFLVDARC